MTTTKNVSLSDVLFLTYDIEGDLLNALEAYLRKRYQKFVSEGFFVLEGFINNPNELLVVLKDVVYDDLGAFSRLSEWHVEFEGAGWFEPKNHIFKHEDGRESVYLKYLTDSSEVDHGHFKQLAG